MKKYDAALIIAASEKNADLFYATKFLAPDSFIYLQTSEKRIIFMNDLELERAKKQAKVEEVVSINKYAERSKEKSSKLIEVAAEILKEYKIKNLLVPSDFKAQDYVFLTNKGYKIEFKEDPFFEKRLVKTGEEVEAIKETQKHLEEAFDEAIRFLRVCTIKEGFIYYDKKQVTSEDIKRIINVRLMQNNCIAKHTIVACGNDATDPHSSGSGALKANEQIIIDIFPQSLDTMYFADMTRTIVKGRASEKLKNIYETVKKAQQLAISMVKPGADAKEVDLKVKEFFEKNSYKTGVINGVTQGFFHSTGHGIGLEIHEPPILSSKRASYTLKEGNVITIEPGLYYIDKGAVRLEDMVVVSKNGCINLTKCQKYLEIQ
ncbi:aminopeptidase P family protein [Candidatus Woesearchaeota archaeon]|nr:aminopeptidase P family protein [Candidatus Woesearchaeota archaeon]